ITALNPSAGGAAVETVPFPAGGVAGVPGVGAFGLLSPQPKKIAERHSKLIARTSRKFMEESPPSYCRDQYRTGLCHKRQSVAPGISSLTCFENPSNTSRCRVVAHPDPGAGGMVRWRRAN